MARLFLRKLTVSGKGKDDAVVTFSNGLNLISGASNTGKTFIYQCIYYMLGGKMPPKSIPPAEGYTTVNLEFGDAEKSHHNLERSLSGGGFLVTNLQDKKAKPEMVPRERIYELLASHLELTGKKLKKNSVNQTVKLGFPAVRQFVMVDEKQIITEESPIFSGVRSQATQEKSAFKFMLSGFDDSDLIVSGDSAADKQKKLGKKTAFNEMIKDLTKKIGETTADEVREQKEKINASIKQYLDELGSINAKVAEGLSRRIEIQRLIDGLQLRQKSLNSNLDRFNLLLKTYRSDIDRINFVLEGKGLFDQLNVGNCPYCGRVMDHVHSDENVENLDLDSLASASKVEVSKIRSLIIDLESTIKDLSEERATLSARELELKQESDDIQRYAKSSLVKEIEEARKKIEVLNEERDAIVEISIFHSELSEIENRKSLSLASNFEDGLEESETFNQDLLLNEFAKEVEILLVNWNIAKNPRVSFNLENYDIVIDGQARRSHGKGYRAVFYAAFLVALFNLEMKRSKFTPGLLIIDSPLTTHEEADKEDDAEVGSGIQESFFKYLAKLKGIQIIILDNKNPPKEIEKEITYYRYSGIKKSKNQGFIPGF